MKQHFTELKEEREYVPIIRFLTFHSQQPISKLDQKK